MQADAQQGIVTKVLIKEKSGEPMVPASEVQVKARYGIEGNANSDPTVPGQVLLASEQVLAEFGLHPGDLRENVIVRGLDVDAIPSGSVLHIGDEVQVRVTIPCAPCGYIKEALGLNPAVLAGRRGTLGVALTGGTIREGDAVRVSHDQYPSVPAPVYERFLWIVSHVPRGRVTTYKQIADLLGEGSSFARAVPGYLKRALEEGVTTAPTHRVVSSEGALSPHVPEQAQKLADEGVALADGRVNTELHKWQSNELFYQKRACR